MQHNKYLSRYFYYFITCNHHSNIEIEGHLTFNVFVMIAVLSLYAVHSALKLEKSAISKVQKHIICIFKNSKKLEFFKIRRVTSSIKHAYVSLYSPWLLDIFFLTHNSNVHVIIISNIIAKTLWKPNEKPQLYSSCNYACFLFFCSLLAATLALNKATSLSFLFRIFSNLADSSLALASSKSTIADSLLRLKWIAKYTIVATGNSV